MPNPDIKAIFAASRECRQRVGAKPFKKMSGAQKKKFDVCLLEKKKSGLSGAGKASKKKKR